jgi:CBS domain-containing protein
MRVFEVMTPHVDTVPPTMSAGDAWALMRQRHIRHLIVTTGREVVGILSERDAGGRAGSAIRAQRTVADLMTAPVATVGPNDTIRSVANLMRGRIIGCVPVVERGRLVGIVTLSDLLDLLGRGIDRPAKPERPIATHRVAHGKRGAAPAGW